MLGKQLAKPLLSTELESRLAQHQVHLVVVALVELLGEFARLGVHARHVVLAARPSDDEGHDTFVDEHRVGFVDDARVQARDHGQDAPAFAKSHAARGFE
jgi:hypothetical protein